MKKSAHPTGFLRAKQNFLSLTVRSLELQSPYSCHVNLDGPQPESDDREESI